MTSVIRAERKRHQEALLERLLRSVRPPVRPAFLPMELAGLRLDVVRDPAGLPEVFALRYAAYVECAYIDPDDYPLGLEFDDYDDVSVHFVARELADQAMVGYTRLILDVRSRVQADELVDIADYRARYRGALCEMSRLIVRPAGRQLASRGVRYAAFRWAQPHGIQAVVGVSREADRAAFDRRRFLPMEPYRRCVYRGDRLALLRGQVLYGNVFDVAGNAGYIATMLGPTLPS